MTIITEAGITPRVIHYLEEPPDAAELLAISRQLDCPVRDLLRRNEAAFKAASDLPDLEDDAALAAWLATNPAVLQRPIVVNARSGRAVIGRPPERVNEVLP